MNLLTLHYWFSNRIEPFLPMFYNIILIGLIIGIVLAIASKIFSKYKTEDKILIKLCNKLFSFFLYMGLIGFIFFFFTSERIPFLGMRFWWLAWLIIGIIWIVFIVKFILRIPKLKNKREEEAKFKKYLPGKK